MEKERNFLGYALALPIFFYCSHCRRITDASGLHENFKLSWRKPSTRRCETMSA